MLYFRSTPIQTTQTIVKLLSSLFTLSPLVPTMESASSSSKRRTRQSKYARKKGRFVKECGCLSRALFASGKPSIHAVRSHLRDRVFQELIKRGRITKHHKYICSDCLAYSEKNFTTSYHTLPSTGEATNGEKETSVDLDASLSNLDLSELQLDESINQSIDESLMYEDMDHDDVVSGDDSQARDSFSHLVADVTAMSKMVQSLDNWSSLPGNLKDALQMLASALGSVISDLYNDSV